MNNNTDNINNVIGGFDNQSSANTGTVGNNAQQQQDQQPSIADTLAAQRQAWTKEIETMNEEMKDLPHLDEMQNRVYAKRQDAVDYYYAMNSVILNQTKQYRKLYNDMFNNIKINGYNGMRYSSDQMIIRQIESTLEDQKEIIDLLTNQNNFIKDTIATLDNIIYGITSKIKIKEMLNGLKM